MAGRASGVGPRRAHDRPDRASFHTRAAERVDHTIGAEADGSVAGFLTVIGDEVEQIYVSRSSRGTGIADLLLSAGERRIAESGNSLAWLAVVAGNERARAFYVRRGWTDEGPFTHEASSESGPIEVPAHRYTKPLESDRG